ncbi:MAG: DUF4062 domain-containing protein [Sphingobacteriales bacterium]|nr:MAG: DUF4062 domain-containing protein [Sphingobacteriales bacterium]
MKVYISSTYQDLIEYRTAVDRTLRRMGHDVIGMEQYVAEGSKPVERCKGDVRACDVYVIIVAWRYGYVPGLTFVPPDPRSITQIELEEAQASGKPVLAFLLDPEAPWPPNRMDVMRGGPTTGGDILQLRTKLGTEYLAGIFRTPNDLASQVAAAVSAQGLTRQMVDRVLCETSAANNMQAFAQGEQVSDSTLYSIKTMIEQSGRVSAIVLEIDEGQNWWSTRLFLLASLLCSLTPVRQLVFCDGKERFVGMGSPTAIMDGLMKFCPELGVIFRKLREGPSSPDVERETNRHIKVWEESFISNPPAVATNANLPDQIDERTIKVGVRAQLLQNWVGERWVSRCIEIDGYDLNMGQVQQIVDSLLPDVPVRRRRKPPETGFQLLVVDRDRFALELAREWVRSGLPRSPVR